MLTLRLKDITPEAKEQSFALAAGWFEEAMEGIEGDWEGASGDVRVSVTRRGTEVLARGEVWAHFSVPCARCLQEAVIDVRSPFVTNFVPRASFNPLAPLEEPDFEPYEGDIIDLQHVVRDLIVLAIPMAPLCRPDCKGLCPQCGALLNDGPCGCAPVLGSLGEAMKRGPRPR